MAKYSGLIHPELVQLAVLERLDYNTPLDERDPKIYQKTLGGAEVHPYPKTMSGALQTGYRDHYRKGWCWTDVGVAALGLAWYIK